MTNADREIEISNIRAYVNKWGQIIIVLNDYDGIASLEPADAQRFARWIADHTKDDAA